MEDLQGESSGSMPSPSKEEKPQERSEKDWRALERRASKQRKKERSSNPRMTRVGPPEIILPAQPFKKAPPALDKNMSNTGMPFEAEAESEEETEESNALPAWNEDRHPPNVSGFRSYILETFPHLERRDYLLDRLAHHQVNRYKILLANKIRHRDAAARLQAAAPTATASDSKSDGPSMEDFPAGIPPPPTADFPSTFECPFCFTTKTLIKPSDWTKHVLEDIQPLTCTFQPCREPKMFKRQADWVRHENEGHRHLEWWTCDIEDCRHVCYRRDNFLQHLVREHKFVEPAIKVKPFGKSVVGVTWQKVMDCQHQTTKSAQEEPCRFCGKTLSSWKKLTVHVSKHMMQLIRPVVCAVESKWAEVSNNAEPFDFDSLTLETQPTPISSPVEMLLRAGSSPHLASRFASQDVIPASMHGHPMSAPHYNATPSFAMNFPQYPSFRNLGAQFAESAVTDWSMPQHMYGLDPPMVTSPLQYMEPPTRRRIAGVEFTQTENDPMGLSHVMPSSYEDQSSPGPALMHAEWRYSAKNQGHMPTPSDSAVSVGTSPGLGIWETNSNFSPEEGIWQTVTKRPEAADMKNASTQTAVEEAEGNVERGPGLLKHAEETDVEMTSPKPAESVSPGSEPMMDPPRAGKMRQVGVAKITIELLSLAKGSKNDDSEEEESDCESEEDAEECRDDDAGGSGSNEMGRESGTSADNLPPAVARRGGSSLRRERSPEERDGERHQKRPKTRPGDKASVPSQQRFACPYQAFERRRDCFQPAKRNPLGGCDGIKRVRYGHLYRGWTPLTFSGNI